MQGNEEFEKSGRKIALGIEVLRRGVDTKTVQLVHARETLTGVTLPMHPRRDVAGYVSTMLHRAGRVVGLETLAYD